MNSLLALCLSALVAGAESPVLDPTPVNPSPHDSREAVRRVPDRIERIDLAFPETEGWTVVNRDANQDTHVELIELGRTQDELDRWADAAEVFVFHSSWRTDISRARAHFLDTLREQCPGASATDWLREDLDAPRRITVYDCPSDNPVDTRAVVQLMLQGMDNFYSVNIYLSGSEPSQGILIKWVEFLKEVRPCVFGGRVLPCQDGLWDSGRLGSTP
ncbi:MAG: hypothetical protein KDC10_07815 [Calditrichaeota bacterium]|nr:hypothetical protein [Candidatus Cloacimonadota bacterium]MCA9785963.1 hypothetical protein [Candidatus Cloacimonadota bacterium]MCB1047097.1 hypothetical protein [Calditrichota bacterium]MCB9474810.1 hypothetical protein [Candidatus Delongbacteria bacterium]